MSFAPLISLAGGALIGLSASVLLVLSGRVAGISGILGGIVHPVRGEVGWRAAFLLGLLAGALWLAWCLPNAVAPRDTGVKGVLIAFGGLLVGFGTQLGGGCTSGHGVCGLSRLSGRSLVAVLTFMAAGVAATFLVQHVLPRWS
jgi:uncharacterized protein